MILGVSTAFMKAVDNFAPPKRRSLQVPKGWPEPEKLFKKNPLTEEGFRLGRKLFYDNRLSRDESISCASCHQPFAAFSNYDHDLSHGVENSFTNRNAPALFNLAWRKEFNWDGGINHLEVQPLMPITAHNEMGETIEHVLNKLRDDSSYRSMFSKAFGDTMISSKRMLQAITQFTGSLVSANSKYDKVMRGEASFEPYEANGYRHFKKYCAGCHSEPLFTDNSYRNNGLPPNQRQDAGRIMVTGKSSDSLKFRVPSLRNVQFSPPYMHDGSIYSLYKVVDHYSEGLDIRQPGLDPSLGKKIDLTDFERSELVYFLYTLSDTSFTRNPEYGFGADISTPHAH
jgi:cytochrome c peroxidase